MFLTGTDEHGQKVAKAAADAGLDPQTFTDRVSQHFRDLSPAMNLSNDDFIRTTEPRHIRACQELWRRIKANGHIYLGKFAGWYAVRDEAFYDESELVDGRSRCSSSTDSIHRSWHRARGRTKSSASSPPGFATSRSRARPSPGACRCPTIPSTSCTSGSTRSPTT
jgi:hypothetical protein